MIQRAKKGEDLDYDDFLERLAADVLEAGGQVKFGRKHGISPTHVSQLLRRVCFPGDVVAGLYGFRVVKRAPTYHAVAR